MRRWGNIWRQTINKLDEKESYYKNNIAQFIDACNEAQNFISINARPRTDVVAVSHEPMQNLVSREQTKPFFYGTKTAIEFDAAGGKAYSFMCDGNGRAVIADDQNPDGIEIPLKSNGTFKRYYGFLGDNAKITFSGIYCYTIKDMAIYQHLKSDNLSDIPNFSQYTAYDIRELTKIDGETVFLDFADKDPVLKTENGEGVVGTADYKREKGHILLLNSFDTGEYLVKYKRYPIPLNTNSDDDTIIDLDDFAADILPYLMAHSIGVKDNPALAVHNYNKGDLLLSELVISEKAAKSPSYFEDTSGWVV